jgi:hypothetical protein
MPVTFIAQHFFCYIAYAPAIAVVLNDIAFVFEHFKNFDETLV